MNIYGQKFFTKYFIFLASKGIKQYFFLALCCAICANWLFVNDDDNNK